MGLNITGLFQSLRNPELMARYPEDISLSEAQFLQIIDQPVTDREAYIQELAKAVSQSISHLAWNEAPDTYFQRVPPTENYILYAASYLYPPVFERYEFTQWRKALERGVGPCSQQAIITTAILNRKGFDSRIVGLDGHVVTTVQVGAQEWVVDADYGAVIRHSLEEIEQDPGLIRSAYKEAGHPQELVDRLSPIYRAEGNYQPPWWLSRMAYHPSRVFVEIFEYAAYVLKWLLPFLLLTRARWWFQTE